MTVGRLDGYMNVLYNHLPSDVFLRGPRTQFALDLDHKEILKGPDFIRVRQTNDITDSRLIPTQELSLKPQNQA